MASQAGTGGIKMKVFAVFSVILMACMAFLLLGCGEEEEEEEELAEAYLGFPEMKGGEWAEHISSELGGAGRIRFEYIGTDTIDGRECFVTEFEMESLGQKTISQIWIDREKEEITLYVVKVAGMVLKMDVSELPTSSTDVAEGASGETPDKYEPGTQTSVETYMTPTAKMAKAAVFKTGSDEQWVSGDVPFGIVKIVDDGEPVMELYDFSFSGAIRDISREEAENATSMPSIPGIPFPSLP
jgi:hypothetical protein